MKNTFDATAFFGDYPFRGFARTSLSDLAAKCAKLGVGGAAVCSFNQIFWENNLEAARRDASQLEKFPSFEHFMVVNPAYPRQIEEAAALLCDFPVRGIRLLPTYHRYHLWHSAVHEVFALAREHDLTVQIHREIQDERLQWLLHVPPLEMGEMEWLLANPPHAKVLLSGLSGANIRALKAKILAAPQVQVDLCRMRGPVFGLEQLTELLQAKRLVYGSLWPLQNMSSTLLQVQGAQISDEARQAILQGVSKTPTT